MMETLDDLELFLEDPKMDHPRISQDPGIMFGKPVIRGTRVTVEVLLELLGSGMTVDEVAGQYPHITRDDVLAAQTFAADYLARTKGRPVAAE